MVGTATVTARSGGRAALRRRLHRVQRQRRRLDEGHQHGGREPVRVARSRSRPRASTRSSSARRTRPATSRRPSRSPSASTSPSPGTPVIEAFADPATGAAPLLTRFSASGYDPDGGELSYKWEFADGTVLGRARRRGRTPSRARYTAKVTATDDEGDKTSKEVTVTVTARASSPRPSRSRPTAPPAPARWPSSSRPRAPTRTATPISCCTRGSSVTAARSFAQNPTHAYIAPGTYTAKRDGERRRGRHGHARRSPSRSPPPPATWLRSSRTPAYLPSLDGNPLEVTFTAGRHGPERRQAHVRVGLRRQLGEEVRHDGRRTRYTAAATTPSR